MRAVQQVHDSVPSQVQRQEVRLGVPDSGVECRFSFDGDHRRHRGSRGERRHYVCCSTTIMCIVLAGHAMIRDLRAAHLAVGWVARCWIKGSRNLLRLLFFVRGSPNLWIIGAAFVLTPLLCRRFPFS